MSRGTAGGAVNPRSVCMLTALLLCAATHLATAHAGRLRFPGLVESYFTHALELSATRYLEGGNDQLAVYRDNSRPTFVGQEFRTMIDDMPELTTYMPDLRRYLLDYPRVTIPDATSFLYWQETEFGLRPTIRISHVTIRENPDDTVVTSKMLYASHYFWTGLELRALVPDPPRGSGFWFVTMNRSRSDGLSGFRGFFVRRRVRSEVQNGALAALRSTKQRLENAR